jgi:hypothetical protein
MEINDFSSSLRAKGQLEYQAHTFRKVTFFLKDMVDMTKYLEKKGYE